MAHRWSNLANLVLPTTLSYSFSVIISFFFSLSPSLPSLKQSQESRESRLLVAFLRTFFAQFSTFLDDEEENGKLDLVNTYGGRYFYIVKSEDFLTNVSVIISQKNYNQLSHQVADLITKLFIGQVNFHSKISDDIFTRVWVWFRGFATSGFHSEFLRSLETRNEFFDELTFTLSRQKYDYTYLPILNIFLYLWSCLVQT